MLRVFQTDILDPEKFVFTLELVPGRHSTGRSVDTVKQMAADAFADGRISAVSITDNPGGNPSLSPDVISRDIFRVGMDVIVHFTCRDTNRVGMESRALQLAMMGMKNILALTGDYTGKGFGGQGAPVFDLDSVNLQILFSMLADRMRSAGDPDGFFTGCAVSPFKARESEVFAQYAKLCKKAAAGARFTITQLGYDFRKFKELLDMKRVMGLDIPVLASVYLLTPKVARIMNQGKIPGAVVTDGLLAQVNREWADPAAGRRLAIDRAARLAALVKGLGYDGVHLGGIHRSFDTAARILDRMAEIQDQWREFIPAFHHPQPGGFYVFPPNGPADADHMAFGQSRPSLPKPEAARFHFLRRVHGWMFDTTARSGPLARAASQWLEKNDNRGLFFHMLEDPAKRLLLDCQQCGDCAISHTAFICPESQCPKHIRNGACGGSRNGRCEVHPDKDCVWVRAYRRLASVDAASRLAAECVPPRMWELNQTSSWINFHLGKDHQSVSTGIADSCRAHSCRNLMGGKTPKE